MDASLLRLQDVIQRVRLSRTEIYRRVANGSFPKAYSLGSRAVAWRADEISRWIDERTHQPNRHSEEPAALTTARAKFWQDVREGKRPHPRSRRPLPSNVKAIEKRRDPAK